MKAPLFKGPRFWVQLAFIALAASAALALTNRGLSLKLFNLSLLISLVGGAVAVFARVQTPAADRSRLSSLFFFLAATTALGASKWLWAKHFGTPDEDLANNNLASGVRIVAAAAMFWFLHQYRDRIGARCRKLAGGVLLAGLIAMLVQGIQAYMADGLRVRLNTDAATTAAYIITGYGLTTGIVLRCAFKRTWLALSLYLGAATSTIALLALTDTRSAILLSPWLFLAIAMTEFPRLGRSAKLVAMMILALSGAFASTYAWERISTIQGELESYSTDNNSSIGARLTLWKAGLFAQSPSILGETVEERYSNMKSYIETHEAGNPEALGAIRYHLHNEMLDTLSLRGIAGAVTLFAFYAGLLGLAIRTRSVALLVFSAALIGFGQVDVVLHQRLACLALFACLALVIATLPRYESA